jgi:hypothetical protein
LIKSLKRFLNKMSQVSGNFHAQFRENVKELPCLTRLAGLEKEAPLSSYQSYPNQN